MSDYTIIGTKQDIKELFYELKSADIVCFDLETRSDESNLEDWHPSSRTVSASYTLADGSTYVVPLSHPDGSLAGIWRAVLTALTRGLATGQRTKLVGHNLKYDVRWAYSMTGICLREQIWWDTMMSSYILDENRSHRLKNVAVRDLGIEDWSEDIDLSDAETEDLDKLLEYNARDTDYCLRLVPVHKQELLSEPRLARLFHFLAMPSIRMLVKVERNGLPLDVQEVKKRRKEAEDTVVATEENLMAIAIGELGMDPEDYPTITFASSNAKWFQEFMDRMEFPVIKYTKSGNISYDQSVLEELERQGYPDARKVLDHRKAANKLSKFFIPWTEKLAEDGRLHPSFNPMLTYEKHGVKKGTVTGRLSSSNPNAQQIARELKPCFGGTEGWLFVEIDYSQIELRVAAWLSRDENMLDALKKGEDLHRLLASEVLDKNPEEIDEDERHKMGKTPNFGFLYEMWWKSFIKYAKEAFGVEFSESEAKIVHRAFLRRWSGIPRWWKRQHAIARRHGFVRNPLGRKRRLPDIYSENSYLRGHAERQAVNAPVQSFASDLMLVSLIEIDKRFTDDDLRIVGTVHDSVLLEVREDRLDTILDEVASIMVDPCLESRFGVDLDVPLEVEAKIGFHWGDSEAEARVYTQ